VKLGLWLKTYREVEVLPHSFLISVVQAPPQKWGGGAARLQPLSANRDFRGAQISGDMMISNFYAMYPLVEIGH